MKNFKQWREYDEAEVRRLTAKAMIETLHRIEALLNNEATVIPQATLNEAHTALVQTHSGLMKAREVV